LACFEHATAGAELYEVGEHAGMAARYGNHDAGACGRCVHAVALALHGDLIAARATSQAAIRLTEELAHPFSQVLALFLAAMSEQIAGEHTAARQHAERSARLATEHGFALMSAWASCIASWAMVVNGERAPGISGIRSALNAAQATGTEQYQSYFFGVLADACRIAGSTSEGLAAVRSGLEAARTTNERFYEAELLRLEGELERSNGAEPYRCAALLQRAVETSRHQAAHLLELRALTSLVRTLEGEPCAAQLLRIGVLLESLALQDDSADAREARLLLRGSRRNPTAIS
jgi:predicted ATPase